MAAFFSVKALEDPAVQAEAETTDAKKRWGGGVESLEVFGVGFLEVGVGHTLFGLGFFLGQATKHPPQQKLSEKLGGSLAKKRVSRGINACHIH